MRRRAISILIINIMVMTLLSFTSIVTSAAPPNGYDQVRNNIPHGTVNTISYYSKTMSANRKAMIYTPPGYSTSQKYSVMYLCHGVGGDETEWYKNGKPHIILDNLYSENKLAPMIVVLPNCKAGADTAGFENFQFDLINDLIPYINSHYPVYTNPENQAIAGLSAGGGQAVNFGFKYMDNFANVGGFSPGMNSYSPQKAVPDPAKLKEKMKVIWLSAGDQDAALSIAQGFRDYFIKYNVPHKYYTAPGGHDWPIWKDSLYQFSQLIFKDTPKPTSIPTSTPTSTSTPTVTPGINVDLNNDGAVNMADLMPIALIFNTVSGNPNFDTKCDLNKDGVINMADVIVIALKFGTVVN